MRGVTRLEHSELDVASYYVSDPKIIQRIKVAMLDVYDQLVEEDAARDKRLRQRGKPLAPPSLRRILRAMPFWVNERLGCEIRRQLIESGDIQEIRKANPKAVENGMKRIPLAHVSQEEIEESKRLIMEQNMSKTRDEPVSIPSVDRMTPEEISEWARKRYWAAWRSIQGLHMKAALGRLQDRVQALDLRHVPRRDELFGG
jgi:hypothetical protein